MDPAELALAFANTRLERPSGLVDTLIDPADARRWLADHFDFAVASPAHRLRPGDHRQLLELRDAVRRILLAHIAREPVPARERNLVNRASAAAPRHVELSRDGQRARRFSATGHREPRSIHELYAELADATIDLLTDPPADVAQCAASDCVVLFLRTDPRRRWHSQRCGNRMRAASSYARRRSGRGSDPPDR